MPEAPETSGKVEPLPIPQASARSRINHALGLYLFLLLAVFTIEWGHSAHHALVLHDVYPSTTPLFNPVYRFTDWTNFVDRVAHFGQPGMQTRTDLGFPYPYPLPSLFIFLVFIKLFPNPLHAYIVFTLVTFLGATLLFLAYLRRRTRANRFVFFTVWVTMLTASPAYFLLDRGNIEVFLWLFVLLGLVCYLRDWPYAAAFFFALAACMKIYPALYFLLFLPRRQYKAAALGVVLSAGFTLLALAAVGPSIPQAVRDMAPAAEFLRKDQIVALNQKVLRFDHSVLSIEKQALFRWLVHRHHELLLNPPTFERSVRVYSVLAPLTFLILYLARIRRLPLLNQFIALTILSVILPYVSYDYTLVHIYLVFAAFLVYLVQDGAARNVLSEDGLKLTLLCFAVVFAPLSHLASDLYPGQVKGVALIALLTIALIAPMPSTLFHDKAAAPLALEPDPIAERI